MTEVAKEHEVDPFATAFDTLAELGDKPVPADLGEPKADDEPKPVVEGDGDGTPPAEGGDTPASDEPAGDDGDGVPADGGAEDETPPAALPAKAPSRLSDEELVERLAKAVKPEPAPAQQPQPQVAEIYTPDEQAFLTEYEKEWPDVARAEALRRRSEYKQMLEYVFDQVATRLNPLQTMVQSLTERTHLGDLYQAEPEYDTLRDRVVEWAQKQPAWLQPAYARVINEGTVDEVADLINRFKQDTGYAKPAPKAPAPQDTELPPATKQAVKSLAPVSSKRTAVIRGDDPNDFEGSFSTWAEAEKL
jgi:hypothetical protein